MLFGVLSVPVVAQQQPPPQQAPQFKSGTQVVEVDVRVFDKDGRFVTDLKPEDFEIKEDGAPQPITALTLVAAPSTQHQDISTQHQDISTQHPALSTAPSTQHPAPSTLSAPSTWLFVFDTYHLSAAGVNHARDAVGRFLADKFRDGDMGGIVADGKMANNRLTSVREELEKAVEGVKLPGEMQGLQLEMTREWPRLQDEYEAWRIAVQNDPGTIAAAVARACADDPTLCPNADAAVRSKAQNVATESRKAAELTLRVADALANGLARMPGPKSVVFLSEGFMLWDVQSRLRDVVGQTNRAGAHIYAIDVRGLNKGRNAGLLTMNQADDVGGALSFDEQVDGPSSLAIDTGGMFIENENNLGRALGAIEQDAATYYVLGYTPSNQTFDGKYRGISVTVKRAGVKVRARRGYLAIEPAKMLRTTPIATEAPAGTNDAARVVSPADAPADAPANTPADTPLAPTPDPAVTAAAVRTRIDRGGLVAALRGADGAADSDDAASRGWAAYQKGDVETAERNLTEAAASADAHPWVHYVLGLSHLALNEYAGAAASWQRVRDAVPTFEPVYFNLADAYLLQNDGADAVRVLEDAAARWPKDPEVYNARGVIELRAGALPNAVASFERATKVAPNDALSYFNLASAHHVFYVRLQHLANSDRNWTQGVHERNDAIDAYRRCIALGGQYVDQAKAGLAALKARD